MKWSDTRLLDLFGMELPIIAAPMANFAGVEMAIAVAEAGGLGSLPCATLSPDKIRAGVAEFRSRSDKPLNVNFFCHTVPGDDLAKDRTWLERIAPYFAELGVKPPDLPLPAGHPPFDEADCAVIEELCPEIVSFHFGLPAEPWLKRVRGTGCKILSSATSLREAKYLAECGLETDVTTQVGTLALVRAIAAALNVPVIAAGGIADGKAIAGALALGASAVQIGTAYLTCPESTISDLHRNALAHPDRETAITNVMTGRPARGIVNRFMREQGPMDDAAPNFQRARPAIAPLRTAAEAKGSTDFSPLWSGQAANLPPPMGAAELTRWFVKGLI
jgi:nitronate monooxygenase